MRASDPMSHSEKLALVMVVLAQCLGIFTWYLGHDLALTIATLMPWIRLGFAVVASAALDMVVVTTTMGRRDGRRSAWSWATILSAATFSAAIALDVAGGPSAGAWLHVGYAVNIFLFAQHVAHPRLAPASAPLDQPTITISAPEVPALPSGEALTPNERPLLAGLHYYTDAGTPRFPCARCGVALASARAVGASKTNKGCKECRGRGL